MTNATNKVAAIPAVEAKLRARIILGESFADLSKVPPRMDIIKRLVTEAAFTTAEASMYLQHYKNSLKRKALAAKA